MEQEIINGEVVITTKVDLATYVDSKRKELEFIQTGINDLNTKANQIIAELQSLIEE